MARTPKTPAPNYPQLAKADVDAAYNAKLAAADVIAECDKITAPPNAVTIAGEAKAKAQEVEPHFNVADAAWRAVLKTTVENTAKRKANEASTNRVDAERKLGESQRKLAEAQRLAGAGDAADAERAEKEKAEKDAIKEIVRQIAEIREDIGNQYAGVQRDAEKAADAHEKAGTDDTQQEVDKVEAAETAIETAYETSKRAEESAKRAKTKSSAESALKRAEKAQEKVEAALLKAGDAVQKVETTARRAEKAKQNTPQSTRDKAKSSFGSWLKPRVAVYAALAGVFITLVIALLFGFPSWVPTDWVVTIVVVLAVAVGLWAAKPLPEGDKHVAIPGQAFAFALLVFCVILMIGAIRLDDGGSSEKSNDTSTETETDSDGNTIRYETVDGTRYRIVETPTPTPDN